MLLLTIVRCRCLFYLSLINFLPASPHQMAVLRGPKHPTPAGFTRNVVGKFQHSVSTVQPPRLFEKSNQLFTDHETPSLYKSSVEIARATSLWKQSQDFPPGNRASR